MQLPNCVILRIAIFWRVSLKIGVCGWQCRWLKARVMREAAKMNFEEVKLLQV